MCVLNVTDLNTSNENDSFTDNYTINQSNIDIIIPTLLITIPCGLSFLCLMSLMVYKLIEPLIKNKKKEKFLYPTHPV